MKVIIFTIIPFFISLFFLQSTFSQGSFESPVPNFECAGYVTEIIPSTSFTLPSTILYARTDIGGIYKSTDDGSNWIFISTFAPSLAALETQCVAVQPGNPNLVLLACGDDYLDTDPGRGIWRTTDGGSNWSQVLGPSNINFGGNNIEKLGGECILFDPSNSSVVFAGGKRLSGNANSHIFKSTDAGATWSDWVSSVITGNVSSIAKRSNDIWIGSAESPAGSDAGVWRSTDNGSNWSQVRTHSQMDGAVYRILLKTIDKSAYIAHGTHLSYYSDGGTWSPNITNPTAGSSPLTALMFIKGSGISPETELLISRQTGDNTYYTTNEGTNWVHLPISIIGTVPKHSIKTTQAYSGNSNFSQNPNNSSEWYVSNGAAPLKSTDAGANWSFIPNGINMPVMYDVKYGNINTSVRPNVQYIYYPMSDWTLAYANVDDEDNIIAYERTSTTDPIYTNATRVLTTIASGSKNVVYLTASLYGPYKGTLLKSTSYGAAGSYSIVRTNLNIGTDGYTLVDGLYSNADGAELMVMVGGGDNAVSIGTSGNWGVFRSTNGGTNFTAINTGTDHVRYEGSLVPALFDHSKSLAADPFDNTLKYMYLEENGSNTGGFFKSTNSGVNWSYVAISGATYHRGSITCTPNQSGHLYLAILNQGLYESTNNGDSWSLDGSITSAEQVVSSSSSTSKRTFIFGKVSSETYNHIYKVTSTINEITDNDHKLPSTVSLTLNNNELWIGTQGQGVFVYAESEDSKTKSKIMSLNEYRNTLRNNYPNPFNPSTKINYSIIKNSKVKLTIYDLLGKSVAVLVDNYQLAGEHQATFDASNLASGIYIYRLEAGSFVETKKMTLIK